MGDVIPMPAPNRARSEHTHDMDEVAWAKLRVAKIVWTMPTEEALGVLADMIVRLLRRAYDGETARQAGKLFCAEVELALERADRIDRDTD